MKKRLLSVLLVFSMVLTLLPGTAWAADSPTSGYCGADVNGLNMTWKLDEDGTLTISGTGRMAYYIQEWEVPWHDSRTLIKKVVINDGVNSVGNWAFADCNALTSIDIPSSLTDIGNYLCAGCISLIDISIPGNVINIGEYAFHNCTGLTSATISDGVINIGEGAFSGCSDLTSVYLSFTLKSIEENVFSGCNNLTSIDIPNGVNSIGVAAFSNCTALTEVAVPGTLIGDSAFMGCSGLTSVIVVNGVERIGTGAFWGCNSLTSIDIPDSVNSIGQSAFNCCEKLKNISIPIGVTSIEDYTFYKCTSLTDIIIPASIKSIGKSAFYQCTALNSVTFTYGLTSIGESAFSGCNSLISVNLPNSVTSIEERAFSGCSNMTEITLPNGIDCIEAYVFTGCKKLTNVSIPGGVTTIGEYAFNGCVGLTDMTIPKNTTSIGKAAFQTCQGLKSVSIPKSVSSIGDWAFQYCISLADVYYSGTQLEWQSITIGDNNERLTNATIHYNSTIPESPTTPNPSKLTLVSSSPANGSTTVSNGDELSLTFSGPIDLFWANGTIRLVNYATDEIELEIDGRNFYQLRVRVSGATLIMGDVLKNLTPGKYSILIDANVITASEFTSDGTLNVFSGINDKDELVFTIPESTIVEVPSTTFATSFGGKPESVEWNDGWFQYPATTYIHKLSIAAAALSNAAYDINQINDVLRGLDFDKDSITSSDYEWSVSSNGSAGYTFAHKTISVGSEQFTLVAVVVRGSKNTADWLSNFLDSGWIDGDSGFEDAAKGIMQALKAYCAEKSIDTGNAKFLVTGHSRGGLIANIIAADLTTQDVLDDVHFSHIISQSGVFGYTFASPRPASFTAKHDCPNIWNIINYPDIVPKIPKNGTSRDGTDLFLPHKKYYASHKYAGSMSYVDFSSQMKGKYASFTGEPYVEPHWNELVVYLTMPSAYIERIASAHSVVAYYSWLSSYEADELFDTKKNPMYKELTIACPVDAYVYDEAGVLVASIVNDVVVVDDLEAEVVVENPETQEKVKNIYLPTDQTYSIEIKATGEGAVSYTVKEMEVTGEESLNETLGISDRVLRTVSFDNIEIVADDILTGKVDDPFSIPAADYALIKNGTEVIHATSDSAEVPAPTDLTWGKLFDKRKGEWTNVPGAISGTIDAGVEKVRIHAYRKASDAPDEYVFGLEATPFKVGDKYMFDADMLIAIEDFVDGDGKEIQDGTYYFIATAISSNGGQVSEGVQSENWAYTQPDSRIDITALQSSLKLTGHAATWNPLPDQALYYYVELLYSEKAISNPKFEELELVGSMSLKNNDWSAYNWDDYPEDCFSKSGYYYVRLRVISSDITARLNSYWSEPSAAYYYNAPATPGTPSTPVITPSAPTYTPVGGPVTSQSYTIKVQSPIFNGTVETNRTSATKGSKVTIAVTPDDNYELETLVVKDANGNTVSTDAADDNHYEFIMPNSNVTVDATFIYSKQFIDVVKDAFYYDAVLWAIKNGVTNGTGTDTFSPANPCTRGEIVTFLWRANGSPKVSSSNIFADVDPNAFYYDAVLWATANGITNGTGIDTFSPYGTCTRGEAVTFLHRSKGTPIVSGNAFIDVSDDAFYANAVSWAVSNGVTNGTGANTFSPNNICTRGEIVTFLYRAN